VGNQPNFTPKIKIKIKPNQKDGTEIPNCVNIFKRTDEIFPSALAIKIHSGTPMRIVIIKDRIASENVTGIRSAKISLTGS